MSLHDPSVPFRFITLPALNTACWENGSSSNSLTNGVMYT